MTGSFPVAIGAKVPCPPREGPGVNFGASTIGIVRRRLLLDAVLLAGYALLVVARAPGIVLDGRLWAEESFHVMFARQGPALSVLFSPLLGYYDLVANLAGFLAARLPLELAPRVTVGLALAVQVLPATVLLRADIPGLRALVTRCVGLLVLLYYMPTTSVWLNTISSQYYLCLTTGLLLVARPPASRRGRLLVLAVLVLAGLTGLVSLFLTPLYALAWWRGRDPARRSQVLVLAACGLAQAVLMATDGIDTGRHLAVSRQPFAHALLTKGFLYPLTGEAFTGLHSSGMAVALAQGEPRATTNLLVACATVALTAAIVLASRVTSARWLLAASLGVALVSFLGSRGAEYDAELRAHIVSHLVDRYYVAPMTMLWLALLMAAGPESRLPDIARGLLYATVLWMVALGAWHHLHSAELYRNFFSGPSWADEVVRWRADPTYALRIWPRGWTLVVPPP